MNRFVGVESTFGRLKTPYVSRGVIRPVLVNIHKRNSLLCLLEVAPCFRWIHHVESLSIGSCIRLLRLLFVSLKSSISVTLLCSVLDPRVFGMWLEINGDLFRRQACIDRLIQALVLGCCFQVTRREARLDTLQ